MNEPGVWILAELEGSLPARITFELLGAGRALADALGQPLGALLMGAGVTPLASQLITLGADRVVVADHPSLQPASSLPSVDLVSATLSQLTATHLLAGHTPFGVELAGRIAYRLETGLVTACTSLVTEGEQVVGVRPLPDGGTARVIATSRPGIFTLRPGHHAWPTAAPDRQGEVMALEIPADREASRIRVLESVPEPARPLPMAEVVVAGGLGMGGPEHWPLLERLASLLGGTVGASRSAVEAGWRPDREQIGLGGHLLAPRLYVACGIHGSPEHLAALRGAPTVIAIHPDPAAPMMRRADIAVHGDPRDVLPAWIDALTQASKSDR